MEFERSNFRVHDRIIPHKFFLQFSNFCSSFFQGMFITSLILFIVANISYSDGAGIIKNQWNLYLEHQSQNFIKSSKLSLTQHLKNQNKDESSNLLPKTSDLTSPATNFQKEKDSVINTANLKTDNNMITRKRTSTYMRGDLIHIYFLNMNVLEPNSNHTWDFYFQPKNYDLSTSLGNFTVSTEREIPNLMEDPTLNWWIKEHAIVVNIFSWYRKSTTAAMMDLEDMIILDIIETFK